MPVRGSQPPRVPSSKSVLSTVPDAGGVPSGNVNVQPSARRSVTTVRTAASVPDRSPPPSCARTSSPGTMAVRRLAVRVATSWVSQSAMVFRTASGCMPSSTATPGVTPQEPFGARQKGTFWLGSPSASRMIPRFSTRSARTCSWVQEPMSAYDVEWLHRTWPSATIRRSSAAPPSAWMFCPITQKTAFRSCSARKSSRAGVVPGFGPSSKVRAEAFPLPSAAYTGVGTGLIAPPGTTSSGGTVSEVVTMMSSTRSV